MLVPSTSPSLPYFRTGLYEQDLTDQLVKQIRPGQNIVDLGANTGYYTLVASKLVGSSGRAYAFEPDPAMFDYLTRNIALNGCQNVTAVQQAVSDRVGSASFIRQDQERGFLSAGDPSGSLEVPTVTLDDYFSGQGWPAIHLVKMDVEGSELAALLGMIELSRRNPQLRLVMEFNLEAMRRAGVSSLMLTAALGGLGFRDASVIEKRLRPVPMQPSLRESGIVHDLLLVK